MTSSAAFLSSGFDAQGTSFAAVFQGIDAYRIRVVPSSQSTNVLTPQEFVFDNGVKISALEWASAPTVDKSQQLKKRKKAGEVSNESTSVVILGTTQGTILVYSPASNSVIANMKSGSSAPVSAIAQVSGRGKVHVLQTDSTLTEFDLARNVLVASSIVPLNDPTTLVNSPEIIMANTAPHLCKSGGNEIDITYTGFATPVRQLLMLGSSHFAAVAEEDRQVLIYQMDSPKPVHSLMCSSTNAVHISAAADNSAVAITTEDGQVHVFESPLKPNTATAATKPKRSKPVPQSSPKFTIEVVLAKRNLTLPVAQTRFADNQIVLAWPEQGSVPIFDNVAWKKDDGSVVNENIKLEKTPSAPLAKEHLVGGVDPASAPKYEEQAAKVVSGEHVGDLSDNEGDGANDDDDGETLADRLEALEVEMDKRKSRGHSFASKDIDGTSNGSLEPNFDENSESDSEEDGDGKTHPTTGTNGSRANNAEATRQSQLRRKDLKLKLSQPGSFATLLNQALTLNDKQLLEICLEERDAAMIKTSIVKLEPALAANLLEHLASTMARSQNRSTTLTQWIRWVVVIHGAYLVTLPNLLKMLASLHSTLSTRASTLPRLLALQGRLELLEEQLAVRNELAAAAAEDNADEPEAYFDEEEALIVNGEEANEDISEGESRDDDAADDIMEDDDSIMLSE